MLDNVQSRLIICNKSIAYGDYMKNSVREREILNLLADRDQVSVSELAEHLGVSEATVRRDLQTMEEQGLLQRIHGGATRVGIGRHEPFFQDKMAQNRQAKESIARKALELIEENDHIYLDGGSTVLCLARLLDQFRSLTIVTNSLMVAAELMETTHDLILVGGQFRSLSRTLVGPLTQPIIEALHVDKAFMGTMGFTAEDGMTTTDFNEAFTKERIMERAGQVVLLADSSKLGKTSFVRSGRAADVDILITDKVPSEEFMEAMRRVHVKVILAGAEQRDSILHEI